MTPLIDIENDGTLNDFRLASRIFQRTLTACSAPAWPVPAWPVRTPNNRSSL
jgi:hypothetical protein